MQNQTNTKASINPKYIFKSAKKFLEKLNLKEESSKTTISFLFSFFELGFTRCNDEQPLKSMELQDKETIKD